MAKVKGYIREIPAGTGVNAASVAWKKISDDSSVATDSTDADGLYEFSQDGSPGPTYETATYSGKTKYRYGPAQGQRGSYHDADIPIMLRALGTGVIPGYEDPDTSNEEMQVVAGAGLQVTVSEGACLIDGHVYRCTADTNLTIGANASGLTRVDRIVVRLTRVGQAEEGKCELAVLAGTPGAGAPALTKSSATYEYSLAQVSVINGAASFTSGDITDERYSTDLDQSYVFAFPNAFSSQTASFENGDLLYVTGGKLTRLAKGTSSQVLTMGASLPAWSTPTLTVTVQEGDATVDSAVTTLDFDASDFNVTSSPSGEANIALAYGTSAGTPAEGNHTHDSSYLSLLGGTVSGGVTVNGALIAGVGDNDLHIINGQLKMTSTNFTVATGAAAGSGGSLSASRYYGNDQAGAVQVVTGSAGVTTGVLCVVTFGTARTDTNYIVLLTPLSSAASDVNLSVVSRNTTDFSIRVSTAPGTGETLHIQFLVIGTSA